MVYRITASATGELTMLDREEYLVRVNALVENAEKIDIFWKEIPQ